MKVFNVQSRRAPVRCVDKSLFHLFRHSTCWRDFNELVKIGTFSDCCSLSTVAWLAWLKFWGHVRLLAPARDIVLPQFLKFFLLFGHTRIANLPRRELQHMLKMNELHGRTAVTRVIFNCCTQPSASPGHLMNWNTVLLLRAPHCLLMFICLRLVPRDRVLHIAYIK